MLRFMTKVDFWLSKKLISYRGPNRLSFVETRARRKIFCLAVAPSLDCRSSFGATRVDSVSLRLHLAGIFRALCKSYSTLCSGGQDLNCIGSVWISTQQTLTPKSEKTDIFVSKHRLVESTSRPNLYIFHTELVIRKRKDIKLLLLGES